MQHPNNYYHLVTYQGPFGYLKPWTAVRDGETYSQQFLTPSVIEGMRQKLGVEAILRHKLCYKGLSLQQEQTQPRGWKYESKKKQMSRPRSILVRGVMLEPELWLAFASREEADWAFTQHLCLCRNEDLVLPVTQTEMPVDQFETLPGFELRFAENSAPEAFLVGYNRFADGLPMYGRLEITGNPLAKKTLE